MNYQVKQIIIERQLYADEVGITHGFFSAKITYISSRTIRMAPFDSVEQAMFAVKHHLFNERVLRHPFPMMNLAIPPHHFCRCVLIDDKNAEEAS